MLVMTEVVTMMATAATAAVMFERSCGDAFFWGGSVDCCIQYRSVSFVFSCFFRRVPVECSGLVFVGDARCGGRKFTGFFGFVSAFSSN